MTSTLYTKIITGLKRHQKKPNSIIPFPEVNQTLTWLFHFNKREREEVLNELRAQELIDIIPFHGIRLLDPTIGNDTTSKVTLEIQQRLLNAANLAKINLNALFTKSLEAEFSKIYGDNLDKTKQKLIIQREKLQNDILLLEALDPIQKIENTEEKPLLESKPYKRDTVMDLRVRLLLESKPDKRDEIQRTLNTVYEDSDAVCPQCNSPKYKHGGIKVCTDGSIVQCRHCVNCTYVGGKRQFYYEVSFTDMLYKAISSQTVPVMVEDLEAIFGFRTKYLESCLDLLIKEGRIKDDNSIGYRIVYKNKQKKEANTLTEPTIGDETSHNTSHKVAFSGRLCPTTTTSIVHLEKATYPNEQEKRIKGINDLPHIFTVSEYKAKMEELGFYMGKTPTKAYNDIKILKLKNLIKFEDKGKHGAVWRRMQAEGAIQQSSKTSTTELEKTVPKNEDTIFYKKYLLSRLSKLPNEFTENDYLDKYGAKSILNWRDSCDRGLIHQVEDGKYALATTNSEVIGIVAGKGFQLDPLAMGYLIRLSREAIERILSYCDPKKAVLSIEDVIDINTIPEVKKLQSKNEELKNKLLDETTAYLKEVVIKEKQALSIKAR